MIDLDRNHLKIFFERVYHLKISDWLEMIWIKITFWRVDRLLWPEEPARPVPEVLGRLAYLPTLQNRLYAWVARGCVFAPFALFASVVFPCVPLCSFSRLSWVHLVTSWLTCTRLGDFGVCERFGVNLGHRPVSRREIWFGSHSPPFGHLFGPSC
jgi:hypothetical protein